MSRDFDPRFEWADPFAMDPRTTGSAEDRPLQVLLVTTDEAEAARIGDLAQPSAPHLEIDWARSYEAGFSRMTSSRYDAHLLGERLGERSGIDLLRAYHEAGGGAPVLLLGAAGDRADAGEALATCPVQRSSAASLLGSA